MVFVRFCGYEADDDVDKAIDSMQKWGLLTPKDKNRPELIITVTGGAGYYNTLHIEFLSGFST